MADYPALHRRVDDISSSSRFTRRGLEYRTYGAAQFAECRCKSGVGRRRDAMPRAVAVENER
jgi:hypothetical protein